MPILKAPELKNQVPFTIETRATKPTFTALQPKIRQFTRWSMKYFLKTVKPSTPITLHKNYPLHWRKNKFSDFSVLAVWHGGWLTQLRTAVDKGWRKRGGNSPVFFPFCFFVKGPRLEITTRRRFSRRWSALINEVQPGSQAHMVAGGGTGTDSRCHVFEGRCTVRSFVPVSDVPTIPFGPLSSRGGEERRHTRRGGRRGKRPSIGLG